MEQSTALHIAKSVAEVRAALREHRRRGLTIALVPTMGALHEGHLSLVRAARAACDAVVVSIFVNPTQFGPNEDFAKYPRTFEADCAALEREGVDLVFAPAPEEVYLPGASTFVDVEGLSERLDGASRPGHFRGVTTIVSKLFNIVQPDKAFFGQKDAAQVAILRKMVRDLNFGIELIVCPIVREPDGLALSSRNRYLSAVERKHALVLSRALLKIEELAAGGMASAVDLIAAAASVIWEEPTVRVDYLRAVNSDTLEDVVDARHGALVAVAAFVGTTRLIDNLLLPAKPK